MWKKIIPPAVFLLIPASIFFGEYFLGDRSYYYTSVFIIICLLAFFFLGFEKEKHTEGRIVIITVLTAIAVAARGAFYMLPQIKPMAAVVIISGMALGGGAGFVTGGMAAFVSNFFFGQGTWTPWQMLALGLIGYLAGVFTNKGFLKKERLPICIYGAVSVFIIYGGIMNFSSVITLTPKFTFEALLARYLAGMGFDALHAGATALFLWLAAVPFIEKIDRIKTKYGI